MFPEIREQTDERMDKIDEIWRGLMLRLSYYLVPPTPDEEQGSHFKDVDTRSFVSYSFSFANLFAKLSRPGDIEVILNRHRVRLPPFSSLRWNAPTKIKLSHELTFLLTANLLHISIQKLLKSMDK